MIPTWQPPRDYRQRAVVVLGGGVLGRRIACIWASAGYNVRIRDPSLQQRQDSVVYVENVVSYAEKTGKAPGTVEVFEGLKEALLNAWLVIEAVPEKLQLKIDTFAQLDALAPSDCILASNSSSYKSSEMLENVSGAAKARILNMHYYMPPQCMVVELMTDGHTEEGIFPFLVERCKEAATLPYVARKQSTGFIFNRLWAAVKRETLTILAEGVSVPEEIDSLWAEMFLKGGAAPCKTMDAVGLDTVALIESHYVEERGLSPAKTVDFLNTNYINNGKLGTKSSHGGLYPPKEVEKNGPQAPSVLVLDVGLSSPTPTMASGAILEYSATGQIKRTLAKGQALPDGVAVDTDSHMLFWTNMGIPGKQDGAVLSLDLNTETVETIVAPGTINTPKQLTLDNAGKKVYFCDREGCRVYRCNFDGSDLEALVSTGNSDNPDPAENIHNWCVGITVAPALGKFYWTQKGPSKGGQGRIFCANISTPAGQSATSRSDVECILEDLPEPIDLELDESSNSLYWTDRGEIPFGNSLNRARLDASGRPAETNLPRKHEVLTRNFNETIGLKIDAGNNTIYVTDLGGSIYRCDLDGKNKSVLVSDEHRAFTGITLL